MKSSPLNTSDNPSISSPRDNPCLGADSTVAALDVLADDGTSYLLPYAQFLYAERISNPAVKKEPDAPPEKNADSLCAGRRGDPGQRSQEAGTGNPEV
jgi:hypothetical protein